MAATGKMYGLCFTSLWNKEIDYDTDVIKCMLTTSSYVPDQDTHQYKSSVTNEVSGTGYSASGVTLTTKTVTYTAGTNKHVLDADDASWASSTITARNAIVYDSSPGSDATRPLICYQAESGDITSTNGTFSVVWNASGIIEITIS